MTTTEPKIYLIDDHKSFTFLTKHVVNNYFKEACEISVFTNALEGLENIIKEQPDYIFLDLAMPEMDGWSFIHSLQTRMGITKLPFEIVIITGSESEKDYKNALRQDTVSHFIQKPIDLRKIKQIFESTQFLNHFLKTG